MVEQAARHMAEEITAHAPDGWTRALLSGHAGGGGSGMTGGYTVPGKRYSPGLPALHPVLTRLAEAVRGERGWDRIRWEMDCRNTGTYTLVTFTERVGRIFEPAGGYQIELDPGYRLPQAGTNQEPGTAPPAGDPDLAVATLRTYLERRATVLGHQEELPPPVTVAQLDDAERRIGRPLPADLRALYLTADGDGIGYRHCGLIENNAWLSLESLVAEYTEEQEWQNRPWYGWDNEWNAVVFDATPPDTVRRCGGHPDWIRFATSEDGNYLAVDMDPARDGRPGQVIATGRDYDEGPAHVADSLTSLLQKQLELLEQGSYETYDDHISLIRDGEDSGGRQIIGRIPDKVPASLQAIHINDATAPVDLAPLTAAPRLRRLHLNRSATADLTPVRDLPVESLRVTLHGGDLAPLAGHPHLSSLDLRTTAPADLTPLLTVPHLRGLDLAGCEAADLTVLADLPDLRYLALDPQQWAVLLDHGKVPPALAAARLAGADVTYEDALALAARLGLPTDGALRAAGRL
ncbi:SMI1/KNR4 family protein [Streptomyces sp. NPDC002908]|uniref:SMI1/KNR4 family protein n=1 Tax=Streptomyces sp. NPDC002908 TaxID=3364670 RepID=UPI0036C1A66B